MDKQPRTVAEALEEARTLLRDLETRTFEPWPDGGYGVGMKPDIQARVAVERIRNIATAHKLSEEERMTLMAALMAQMLIATTKMLLEQSIRMPEPIYTLPKGSFDATAKR